MSYMAAGGVHPHAVWAPHRPRVAWDGGGKNYYDINRLPQPPDSVPPQVSQLSGGGAAWAVVEAQHLPQTGIVECAPPCPCEGP